MNFHFILHFYPWIDCLLLFLTALSKQNSQQYNKAIEHLEDIIQLFLEITIGDQWKPVQTAIVTTTKSILDLQKLLIETHGFKFVLTARFSQDSLGSK